MSTRTLDRSARGTWAAADSFVSGPLPISPSISGFDHLRLIGSGGFSEVFAARRVADDLDVAIKLLGNGADARAGVEVAALRRLGPPVAPALHDDAVDATGRRYLVMDLI